MSNLTIINNYARLPFDMGHQHFWLISICCTFIKVILTTSVCRERMVKDAGFYLVQTETVRSQAEEEKTNIKSSRGVETLGFDCATHLLCACPSVCLMPLRLSQVGQHSSLQVSPPVHVSCCCTLCNPLTEKTVSSSVLPFPSPSPLCLL